MKQSKIMCKKGNFIDDVFGEEIEYARIFDSNGITIIFSCDNKLIIKNFRSTKELIESYISMYNENEFTNMMFTDLDNLAGEVQKENDELKQKLSNNESEERILCDKCRSMED